MGLGKISKLLGRLFTQSAEAVREAQVSYMPAGDQIIWGVAGREMDEAIAAARATLDVFWDWHQTRPADPDCCALKVKYPTRGGGFEYIWLIDILRTEDLVTGLVASEPERVAGLKLWQPTTIDLAMVSDWTFRKDGLYYGHFTTRVLAASHPEVAARQPPEFSEIPLPADVVRH